MHRPHPRSKTAGSALATLLVATLLGATGALALLPTGVWLGDGLLTLADQAWMLFTATPGGWLVERVGRSLSFLVPDALSPHGPERLRLGPAHIAAMGAAAPALIYALRAAREQRWSRARLASNLTVAAAVLLQREQPDAPGSTADVARRLLAARGMGTGPRRQPVAAPAETAFDEANAAARALLAGIAERR